MSDVVLEALLFDGRSAAAAPVRVEIAAALRTVRITAPDGVVLHELPLDRIAVTEAFGTTPRHLRLPGGGEVAIADGAALTAALAVAGRRAGLVDRLEARWQVALGAVAACVGVLVAGYLYGLPAAARWIAAAIPSSAEQRLGDGVLELLDRQFLKASDLPEAAQRAAEERVAEAARRGAPGVPYRLLFRRIQHGPGVNAFALPGGTIVVLDELVRRTSGDDRLVAVVGHELGHQVRRHSMQSFLKAAGVGAAASLLWGDFSGQAATLPAALAMFDYSRDAEREADEDAVRFLRAAGRSAAPMVDALCMLESVERESGLGELPEIFSTHPKIRERVAHVRELAGLGEPGTACPAPPPETPGLCKP
ncbi:MAG TPA: M48 family metallopeptidase [Anaeromyxobacter sp.]